MTCIIGMLDKDGNSYIAGDSMTSSVYTKSYMKQNKIFKKDNFLFGVSGSLRLLQVLQYSFNIPPVHNSKDLDDYLYNDFLKSMRDDFKNNGVLSIKDNVEEIDSSVLFLTEGRLFRIQSDLSLIEASTKFDSVGSGSELALGAVEAFSKYPNKLTPKKMLEESIKIASIHSPSVGGEVNYLEIIKKKTK